MHLRDAWENDYFRVCNSGKWRTSRGNATTQLSSYVYSIVDSIQYNDMHQLTSVVYGGTKRIRPTDLTKSHLQNVVQKRS